MEFSRPEYWSAQPSPSPRDLPNPEMEPRCPTLQADSLPAEPPGKPQNTGVGSQSLLQGIFLTQESNQGLLHCRQILYQLSHQRSPRRKREDSNKIRNERGDVTTDSTEMRRITGSYHEQWCINKVDNLKETERFLKTCNPPRLNHKEIKKSSRPITNKISQWSKTSQYRKAQDQNGWILTNV